MKSKHDGQSNSTVHVTNSCMTNFLGNIQYECILCMLLWGYLDVAMLYLYIARGVV